jgi:hypothetical protein
MRRSLFIFLPGLAGMIFLAWLAFNTRLSYDDFLFAANFKTNSFADAFAYLYRTHAFRWTTFLFEDLVLGLVPGVYYPVSIPLFMLAFYLCWLLALSRLVGRLGRSYRAELSTTECYSAAALVIVIIYFCASQAVESFTSVIIVTDRLLPLLFITLALNIFLLAGKSWLHKLGLVALAFLTAGTAENVSVTLLMGLILYLLHQRFVAKQSVPGRIFLFTAALLLFLALENFSEGRSARYFAEKTYHFTCGTDGVYCANSFTDFIGRYFSWRQLFVLPLAGLLALFAAHLSATSKELIRSSAQRALPLLAVWFGAAAAFHGLAAWRVFECYGPMRMWFPVNILMAALLLLLLLPAFFRFQQDSGYGALAVACMVVAALGLYAAKHLKATHEYRRAYDQRIEYLLSVSTSDSLVEVGPLPAVSLVVQGDITPNEYDDVNRDFKNTYGLPFNVRTK